MWKVTDNRSALILAKALDAASLRHQVIANNIANASTPGFKRSRVVFEELVQTALAERAARAAAARAGTVQTASWPDRLAAIQPQVEQDASSTMRSDGNNVDVEMEMAQLAENTLYYNAAAQLLSRKLGELRYVINEGRR